VLAANSTGLILKQWNGSSYQPVAKPTATSSLETNTLTISINRSDLGGTAGFDFALDTGDTNNPFVERAPNEPGDTYSYQVIIGNPTTTTAPPPPPPPPSPAPKPQFVVAPVGVPHAGKHFVVRARVVVGALNARPASLACTARVGTTPVKTSVVTPPGPYTACALAVPARTVGKTLVVVLKIHFQATTVTRTLNLKIR
jgi:hypothetical protein